jgi:predicted DNA binding protein
MTHIIAVWILNKSQCVVCDLIHELNALMIGGVIYTPLEYATTVAVSSHLNAVRGYRIVYELEANLSTKLNVVTRN